MLLVSERQQWRNGMARIHPVSQVGLTKGFLAMFQDAAVERIRLALHPRGFRAIQSVDANGKDAQRAAMKMRRNVLDRLSPGRVDSDESERRAAGFLDGMQSPP